MSLADFIPALPEAGLAVIGMALLMYGVFRGDRSSAQVSWLTVAAFVLAGAAVLLPLAYGVEGRLHAFGGLYVSDNFAVFMKELVLLGSAFAVIMSMGFLQKEDLARFEFPILILFATVGMMMMVSANDLIALYLGLELQSLALYVVAAFHRDNLRSTEAGLKYFVLGALSSGMLLYGCSLIYGFTGTTNFEVMAKLWTGGAGIGVVVGLVFVIAGLAFKVSAVPFHMWTPDVYEGAPTPVTAFFAVAPKIAAVALFLRVMFGPFGELVTEWQQVIVVISIASMLLGSFAAIHQSNIKRLMAYSSIGHIGFALVGLAAGTEAGVRGVIFYMAIYLFMQVGCFACILCMRRGGRMVEGIADLAGLSRTNPMMALAMAVFMFSMAGIPPLAGFLAKFFVFKAAIDAGLYGLAVIGVLASVVGAFYYVRIIRIMYFDEAEEGFDQPIGAEMSAVLWVTGLLIFLFFVYPAPILKAAEAAAKALLAAG
jgi:NADH-quinone oxidoreductase subunit N